MLEITDVLDLLPRDAATKNSWADHCTANSTEKKWKLSSERKGEHGGSVFLIQVALLAHVLGWRALLASREYLN